ncbi:hypothetical protein NEMIN01_0123 [Nematocida minor]|uniref:uncharacterized protein n=1 Tax=Nematocida minor TaxID=1912983 RepID=UPI00222041E8|nr:uncharacterized protein NEMIN01_0019 [Nematocida minor]XP_051332025.1 uncharacterized protein NEMIN01_0123 [Nematocida minor]KAI5188755.1 hypothetical protein NEMIN01_0019 [Nematocida minor]KAI5188859.1 hypothetical protein NEMIN01_0123 [Nematocida minor]
MVSGITLNQVDQAISLIQSRSFPIKKDQNSSTTLMSRFKTIVSFCIVFFLNIVAFSYLATLFFNNMPIVSSVLKEFNFPALASALAENKLFLTFVMCMGALQSVTWCFVRALQYLYPKRVIFAKQISRLVTTSTLLGACGVISMLAFNMFAKEISIEIQVLLSGVVCILLSPFGYMISNTITDYYVPASENIPDFDKAVQTYRTDDGKTVFEDVYILEQKKYRDANPEEDLKSTDQRLETFRTAMGMKQDGEKSIKTILPLVFSLWAMLITLPLSSLVFLLNAQTLEWFCRSMLIVYKYANKSPYLSYTSITIALMTVLQSYGTVLHILSFFMGSLVGESRCGHSFINAVVNSVKKTALESIEIIANVFCETIRCTFVFSMSLLIELPINIMRALLNRSLYLIEYPIFRMVNATGFMIFGCLRSFKKSFMYFRLGMYPLEYLRVGDREKFFSNASDLGETLYTNLSIFMLLALVIIGIIVFTTLYQTSFVKMGYGESQIMVLSRRMSLRSACFVTYIGSLLFILFIPGTFILFTARSRFILDLALYDINNYMPCGG